MEAEIVICGAGIAGVSSAYHLSKKLSGNRIIIVDDLPPLSLTSDKSTECYRNWWFGPDDAMVALMNRSIAIMDDLSSETNNVFHMNRRGYLYVTGSETHLDSFIEKANIPPILGAGDLRIWESVSSSSSDYLPGSTKSPDGADLLIGDKLIQHYYPFITNDAAAALHVRKAGWFSAQQLGILMLDRAIESGVQLQHGQIQEIHLQNGSIHSVTLADGSSIRTDVLINAAGPYLDELSQKLHVPLPIMNELHMKAAIKDRLKTVPRTAPLLIWDDPQIIDWDPDVVTWFQEEKEYNYLLRELPGGAHTRPEGGPDSDIIIMLWEYQTRTENPTNTPNFDVMYPEITLRGLSELIPALAQYHNDLPKPVTDGGYYTKTPENRPIIGPGPIPGYYLIGALSGFGLMASCAAGELIASHLTGDILPGYAESFLLSRYDDEKYLQKFDESKYRGQL